MHILATHSIERLNPYAHAKGLLVFRHDVTLDLAPAAQSVNTAYQLVAAGCTVVLRALGDDSILLGEHEYKCVAIKGGPVLVLAQGNTFEVIHPESNVQAADDLDVKQGSPEFDLQQFGDNLAACELIKEVDALEKSVRELVSDADLAVVKAMAKERRDEIRK